ncbi:hypothetical protein Goshw_009189 [Gossypium schwendimanii]|uniref:Uncharacterized protein n=1 Tax=Gossypium schwendimanii TaxID=34291 RepID=A0A7J9MHF8_GOSSC|nr:hypothetical protein [Gossypium schwendimanii]
MAANTVSLKLLVDSTSQTVLFAESGKDFVDFMFNILSLPIGSVIKLLTKEQMVGSLGNLYGSLENMNETYIHSPENKDTLLKPIVPNNAANVPPLLPIVESSTQNPPEFIGVVILTIVAAAVSMWQMILNPFVLPAIML